jgi:hypothetical protein
MFVRRLTLKSKRPNRFLILYLPAGEYLVTKPIVFSEEYVWMTNPVGQKLSAAVFIR